MLLNFPAARATATVAGVVAAVRMNKFPWPARYRPSTYSQTETNAFKPQFSFTIHAHQGTVEVQEDLLVKFHLAITV